jgi:hypothetical protein
LGSAIQGAFRLVTAAILEIPSGPTSKLSLAQRIRECYHDGVQGYGEASHDPTQPRRLLRLIAQRGPRLRGLLYELLARPPNGGRSGASRFSTAHVRHLISGHARPHRKLGQLPVSLWAGRPHIDLADAPKTRVELNCWKKHFCLR